MKPTNFFFFLALSLITPVVFGQTIDGNKYLEMKQYNRAKSAFLSEINSSNNVSSWYSLGRLYSKIGKNDSAAICFNKVSTLLPNSLMASLANVNMVLLNNDKAQALLNLMKIEKSATSAKDIFALKEIALLKYNAGDTTNWVSTLDLASSIDKKNPVPFISAGDIYYSWYLKTKVNRNIGLAAGRYEQALYFDTQNTYAMSMLGEIYYLGNRYSESEKYLDASLVVDSNYIPSLHLLGELSYQLGKYEKASINFGKYIKLAEYSEQDYLRYITILYFNKEYKKSNDLILTILDKQKTNPVVQRLHGYTSYEIGEYNEGLKAMNDFFKLRSANDTNKITSLDYEYWAKLNQKNGNDSIAISGFTKAMSMDSTKVTLLEEIAKIYEKQKKYKLASENYEKLIASTNGNVTAMTYFYLGRDYYWLSKEYKDASDSIAALNYLKLADTAFSKVKELSPTSHLGFLWHGRVMAALDPETILGLAKDDYEKVTSILEQKNDKTKYKNDLVESYKYFGYYYYLQFESAKTNKDTENIEKMKQNSSKYWQSVIELDPENTVAKQALDLLK